MAVTAAARSAPSHPGGGFLCFASPPRSALRLCNQPAGCRSIREDAPIPQFATQASAVVTAKASFVKTDTIMVTSATHFIAAATDLLPGVTYNKAR